MDDWDSKCTLPPHSASLPSLSHLPSLSLLPSVHPPFSLLALLPSLICHLPPHPRLRCEKSIAPLSHAAQSPPPLYSPRLSPFRLSFLVASHGRCFGTAPVLLFCFSSPHSTSHRRIRPNVRALSFPFAAATAAARVVQSVFRAQKHKISMSFVQANLIMSVMISLCRDIDRSSVGGLVLGLI